MTRSQFISLWLVIILIILAVIVKILYQPKSTQIYVKTTQTDTILIVKTPKTDTIYRTKIKIITRHKIDTVFVQPDSLPAVFTAEDTLITTKDTINVSFYYPEIYFKYVIKPKPDTTKIIKEIIFNTQRDTINLKWWQRIEAGIIGLSLGLLIAVIR